MIGPVARAAHKPCPEPGFTGTASQPKHRPGRSKKRGGSRPHTERDRKRQTTDAEQNRYTC